MAFLVDTSYSVSDEELHRMKDFMREVVNGFSISETGTRISIVTYDRYVKIPLKFKDNNNAKSVFTHIDNLDKTRNPERQLHLGLEQVQSDVFSLNAGKRQVSLCFISSLNVESGLAIGCFFFHFREFQMF